MAIDVRHNAQRHRYELFVDDEFVGISDYEVDGDTLVFPHTEINPARRGQGLGDQLVRGALEDARRQGRKVRAQCWFVHDFLQNNPDYADLTAA